MLETQELEIAKNLPPFGCTAEEAQSYTRWLATHHYENFTVVSWLLPQPLHQHFYNVYAYCRWADDLGDEISGATRALALLDEWEGELRQMYSGSPSHPVFIALASTVRQVEIPIEPFADLLKAFRQDQEIHRYPDWSSVLGYCRYSANPVGRLVLYLCGHRDPERQGLSDAICTGLQLANFWQDVARDLERDRIYIPMDLMRAHGVSLEELQARKFSNRYAGMMKRLILQTRDLFAAGERLSEMVAPELRVDIELFRRGGLAVLDSIEAIGCDTLHHRPVISHSAQVRLLGRAFISRLLKSAAGSRGTSLAGRNA